MARCHECIWQWLVSFRLLMGLFAYDAACTEHALCFLQAAAEALLQLSHAQRSRDDVSMVLLHVQP